MGNGYSSVAALCINESLSFLRGLARFEEIIMAANGIVKWFNSKKGYGFIQPDEGGKDIFIHISALERAGLSSLAEGQKIGYEIVSNKGRESAENIKLID